MVDFDLNDSQRMLKDSVERLVCDRYDFEQRTRYSAEPDSWSRALWREYAAMGLLGLPFAEEYGGYDGGAVEIMIVMQAFGRALVLEPYFATVVLAGGAVHLGGTAIQKHALLPRIADGSLLMAFAHSERQSRYDLADVGVTARTSGTGWLLDGLKTAVIHGDCANKLVVSARLSGARRERNGIALFLVDGKAAGLLKRAYPTQDGLRGADIALSGVQVGPDDLIGSACKGLEIIEAVADHALAALAAEAVGAMEAMHTTTLEYLKIRRQFGVSIGSFQALQHRAVDMLVALEQARSMAIYGAMMVGQNDAAARSAALSATKIQIGKSARYIGQNAIQLHGGIGVTQACKVGHYFKRTLVMETQFGDVDHHIGALVMAAANEARPVAETIARKGISGISVAP